MILCYGETAKVLQNHGFHPPAKGAHRSPLSLRCRHNPHKANSPQDQWRAQRPTPRAQRPTPRHQTACAELAVAAVDVDVGAAAVVAAADAADGDVAVSVGAAADVLPVNSSVKADTAPGLSSCPPAIHADVVVPFLLPPSINFLDVAILGLVAQEVPSYVNVVVRAPGSPLPPKYNAAV